MMMVNKSKVNVPDDIVFPQEFDNFIKYCMKVVDNMKYLKASGTRVVETGLHELNVEQLETIKEIMKFKAGERRGSSEERVMKCLDTVFPIIGMMEHAKTKIDHTVETMMTEFVAIYADEYSSYGNGVAKFDNESFIDAVVDEIATRKANTKAKAVKRREADDEEPTEREETGKQCAVM